ncbi:neuronal acetylcholine receptor subunit alpha-10-like [Saccoglossus kowalevskii]
MSLFMPVILILGSTMYSESSFPPAKSISNRLVEKLLLSYNPVLRPVLNETHVTKLEMLILISQILDMNERMQKLITNAWVTLVWKDELLTWEPHKFGGLEYIKIPSELIWLPEVILYNNADDLYRTFLDNRIVKVDYNGSVLWASPVIFHSTCHVHVKYFPFDHQLCELKFGPWQYNGNELIIHGLGDSSIFTSDGEWDMISLSSTNNVMVYPDEPGVPYTDVTYGILLSRRAVFHVINLLLPCGLLTASTALVFFLPVESGEKISFGITILLSLTVFLLLLAELMPPSSVIPIVGQFYAVSMVLVSLSVGVSAAVVNIHHCGQQRSRVPCWVKKWIIHKLGRLIGIRIKRKCKRDYTVYARNKNIKRSPNAKTNDSSQSPLLPRDRDDKENGAILNEIESCGRVLHRDVLKIRQYFDHLKHEEDVRKEWRLVAMVVDRLCMIGYVVCIVGCTVTIIIHIQYDT